MKDLRDWLELMEGLGQLRRVEGADWNLELGAITELNSHIRGAPALLFQSIKDYHSHYGIVTGTTSNATRLGATLRLSTSLDDMGLVKALRGKSIQWETEAENYAPHLVEEGPVQENVQRGSQVDLTQFPAPKWHERDGGRYLGTGCVVVTKDRDTGWINVGVYRMMLQDERSLTLHMVAGKHGRQQIERYFALGEPFPVVVSLGHDPLLFLIAGLEVPYGISEYNYVGAILGQPLEVVRGEVTGLPMPAYSEVVLEGWCRPGNLKNEGPFGEFTGYYSYSETPQPVMEVERVYFRNDPIILGAPPGRPPHDFSYYKAVMRSAMLHDALEKAGVPGVQSCWADEVGGSRQLLVVSIQQRYPGHSRQAAFVASQCQVGAYLGRYVIVVDEDIDPANLQDVIWAVVTRADPERDIEIFRKAWGSKADPMNVTFNQKVAYNSRAIIDACRPYEYRDVFPPVAECSPEYRQQVLQKWAHLFE
ncbi:MAG: UbiD family decarboxylase [Chloroflexi bacterium]|nr:UbiD family decarboxylase [Chloroflexota bacterium]